MADVQEAADAYYACINKQRPFDDVPFADGVTFRGPLNQTDGKGQLREMFGGFLAGIEPNALELRAQLTDGETVLSVYDLEMGTPSGPIPMAERLRVSDGAIAEIELIFDPSRLG